MPRKRRRHTEGRIAQEVGAQRAIMIGAGAMGAARYEALVKAHGHPTVWAAFEAGVASFGTARTEPDRGATFVAQHGETLLWRLAARIYIRTRRLRAWLERIAEAAEAEKAYKESERHGD